MKNIYLRFFIIFCAQIFGGDFIYSQVSFNYDSITICQGDSYDLMNYQTNEVKVPVGWEIVGWKNISNTTVSPTVSPTVYTLQYREIANPSTILTKDLTITLRPKPTVSIAPSGSQIACPRDIVEIKKVSANNYDNIYWQRIETGDKYYTNDISFTAVSGKYTYKLVATNDNCANLAQDEVAYTTTNLDNPIAYFDLKTIPSYGKYSHSYYYCNPVFLLDYVSPVSVTMYYDAKHENWRPFNLNDDSNPLYKVTRYEIKWHTEDQYTQGIALASENYSNYFTIEADVYFKGCGVTKTFTESRSLFLTKACEGNFSSSYYCDAPYGIGVFSIWVQNQTPISKIIDVQFTNKTTPGKYIPTTKSSGVYYVVYDGNTPAKMTYDVLVTYEGLDGIQRTFQKKNWEVSTCVKQMLINYRVHNYISSGGSSLSNTSCSQSQCYNIGVGNPPRTVQISICRGEPAYLNLLSAIGSPFEVVWDGPEKPEPWNPEPSYSGGKPYDNYTYSFQNGKHTFSIMPVSSSGSIQCLFKVMPQDTTVYSGTLFGVPFRFKVNVVNNHIVVTDTAICNGKSIDLKTLERSEMVNSPVSWSVTNTIVAPVVDTKYLAYGITKYKCVSQADYTLTEVVNVHVDNNVWVTTGDLLTVCKGDTVSLKGGVNTNARNFEWFDDNNQLVPNTVKVDRPATYTANVGNACTSTTASVFVDMDTNCSPNLKAVDDTVYYATCDSVWYEFKIPILDNDLLNTVNPSVKIISPVGYKQTPETRYTYISLVNDSVRLRVDKIRASFLDSVQYEVTSQGKKDTAWVFFEIKRNTPPKISNINSSKFSVDFFVEDGTESFTYWLDDSVSSNIPSYSNLKKGIHKLKVTDKNGCESQTTFVVYDGTMHAANDTAIRTSCGAVSAMSFINNFQILKNDSLTCASPTINVLYSSFASYSVYPSAGNIFVSDYYDNLENVSEKILDSLQYEIMCGSDRDTAWAYAVFKKEISIRIKNIAISSNTVSFDIFDEKDYMGSSYNAELFILTDDGVIDKTQTIQNTTEDYEKLPVVFLDLSLTDTTYYVFVSRGRCSAVDSFRIKNGELYIPPIIVCTKGDTTHIDTTIIQGQSYIFDIKTYTTAANDTLRLKNVLGYDSVIILNLSVLSIPVKSDNYNACPGAKVLLELNAKAGDTYSWYSTQTGGIILGVGVTHTFTKTNTAIDTVWLQINSYARLPVPIYLGSSCGSPFASYCSNGTLLFKEDFGGNETTDDAIKATGIPQVSGYTYIGPGQTATSNKTYFVRKIGYPNGDWHKVDDHTYFDDYTKGYFLQVDASNTAGTFYSKTITDVCPDTKLYFSAWALNSMVLWRQSSLHAYSPNISYVIRDAKTNALLLKYDTGDIPNDSTWYPADYSQQGWYSTRKLSAHWMEYGTPFTVPSGVDSILFSLENNATHFLGADFALDDIEIRLCVPTIRIQGDTVCQTQPVSLDADFVNDGSFIEPLAYKWQQNVSGYLSDEASWKDVSTNKTYDIAATSVSNQGYYRLLIANQNNIDKQACRAVSNTVFLKVNAPAMTSIKDTICANSTYSFNNKSLSVSGLYADTLSSFLGCDSIINLDLKVNAIEKYAYTDSICLGSTYIFKAKTLTQAGDYVDTLQSSQGCDSIVTFTLKLRQAKQTQLQQTICQGSIYSFGGKSLREAGIYTDSLFAASACDSIVTLTLNIKQKPVVILRKEICPDETYLFEGAKLNATGMYTKNYSNPNTCDSTITLYLTVLRVDTTYLTHSIAEGENYFFNGVSLTKPGRYTASFLNANHCDSVILLDLFINSTNNKVRVPELFTPNNDGDNDYFVIEHLEEYPKNYLLIFNRWGNKVYEGKPYMNSWDGRNYFGPKVSGDLLPEGTYFYILDLGDGSTVKKGFIYLNR